MVVQYNVCTFFIVIFIMNLTHNFFNNIFHRHQSGRSSEFINNNGYMNLICLKITQQVIDHLRLRHKISRTNQRLPTKVIPFVHMRQKILDIQHSLDIIPRTGIDRNTRISILNDTLHHLLERCTDIQIDHIQT